VILQATLRGDDGRLTTNPFGKISAADEEEEDHTPEA
jgi:hypothetical protein